MILIAHIAGMPVEELLVPLASGAGVGVLVLARAWMLSLARR
jgi:hypothetical protein